jgi:hypothetical protein
MTKKKNNQGKQPLVYQAPKVDIQSLKHVSDLVNPFAEDAASKKIHDANSSKTFTYKSVSKFGISVSPTGMGYAEFLPTIQQAQRRVKNNTEIGTNGVIPASPAIETNSVMGIADITSSADRYRIVSWGIRIQSNENALDAKGKMLIREIEDTHTSTNDNVLHYSDNYTEVPVTHNMDYVAISRHIGEDYQKFIPPTVNYTALVADQAIDPGYKGIGVTVMGCTPGSNDPNQEVMLFTVEVVYNLELLPKLNSIGMRLSSMPAPHDYATLQATHNVRAALPFVHHHRTLWDKVKTVASKVLSTGANYMLGRAAPIASALFNQYANRSTKRIVGRALPLLTN